MPKLPTVFQNYMQPGSAGGSTVTKAELQQAIQSSSVADVRTFAQQAMDSIADGELISLITAKIGASGVPKPTNSLKDDAAAKKWLDGDFAIKQGDTDATKKQAARVLQRALVKIGVHHPEGKTIATLLQLPWAADGSIGGTTVAAVNQALQLAGKPNLALPNDTAPIGKAVAEAIEGLLKQTVPLVHPTTLNPPSPATTKRVVLFVGMGDHSAHEAAAIKKALPAGYEMQFIGDSALGDDKIKLRVGGQNTVFDLTQATERQRFVDTAFTPALTQDQKTLVKGALEAQAWGMSDARDEIAMMALEFHKCATVPGRAMPLMFFSGHSAGGGVWGDHNGELPMGSIRKIAQAFPEATNKGGAPFFAACNHLHPANVEELMSIFPNMKQAAGYSAYAPGTWVGGIAQALAYSLLSIEGHEVITPEMIRAKCQTLRASAGGNSKNPLFYAMEKSYHLATWNKADNLYRKFEKQDDGSWKSVTRTMGPNPAEIASRWGAVQALDAQFKAMLTGGSPDLRTMTPHGDNLACKYYEAAVALAGTTGLSSTQSAFAQEAKSLGLRARYYGRILEKFFEQHSALVPAANQELSAAGFNARSGANLSAATTTRADLLGYVAAARTKVAAMLAQGQPATNAKKLVDEMTMRLEKFENIPSSWL